MMYQGEDWTTSVGFCPYFLVDNFVENVTQSLFIELPTNLSELNEYMCGALNRKGFQCSEFMHMDGYKNLVDITRIPLLRLQWQMVRSAPLSS